MALPYREFATWTLSDLAIRRDDGDRITFSGNHISHQYLLPVPSPGESDEQYAARSRAFRKSLPRRWDLSERLALAFEAFRRSGEDPYSAAHDALKILREAPVRKQAEYERNGIGYAYKPIDSRIGSTRRGHRTKRKKPGLTREERQIHTIRAQVYRFIRQHKNFAALFDEQFGGFRA